MFESVFLKLTKALYPLGRAFRIPKDGVMEGIHKGLAVSEAQVYEDALAVLNSILPDNPNFTAEDATDWERRLGLITDQTVPLASRKAAIIRKINHPGTIIPRQHYLYVEKALNDANFNVRVYENRFPTTPTVPAQMGVSRMGVSRMGGEEDNPVDYVVMDPNEILNIPEQMGVSRMGVSRMGGNLSSEYSIVANYIEEELDARFFIDAPDEEMGVSRMGAARMGRKFDYLAALRSTFFIMGDTFPSIVDVPLNRKREFRDLILKLKPAQTIALLYVNYVGDESLFTFTINTSNTGVSAGNQFQLPFIIGGNYNCTVEWGDGNSDIITAWDQAETLHTYFTPGEYEIKISGVMDRFSFNNGGDRLKLTEINQWGTIQWASMLGSFYGCSNMTAEFSDSPNVFGVTNFSGAFQNCGLFDADLNGWIVDNATEMTNMFAGATSFNGDVSTWNVSNVNNMFGMFAGASAFNGNISGWNTSSLVNANTMFQDAISFNQPIDSWNVSNLVNANSLFRGATSFNQSLNSWDVSSITDGSNMFLNATAFNGNISAWNPVSLLNAVNMFRNLPIFNQDLSGWNTASLVDCTQMFRNSPAFNSDLNGWNVSGVTSMNSMFRDCTAFNSNLNSWNTSSLNIVFGMFQNATNFNSDLTGWDMSGVTSASVMFAGATSFNGDISTWDVSSITVFASTFSGATSFNQDLNSWDVSSVTSMNSMFRNASAFNGNISSWNVSSVTTIERMFNGAISFNSNITGWNTSSLVNASAAFFIASNFDQNLGSWDMTNCTNMFALFSSTSLSTANYDGILTGWTGWTGGIPTIILQNNVNFGASGATFTLGSDAEDARDYLINTKIWSITDAGGV